MEGLNSKLSIFVAVVFPEYSFLYDRGTRYAACASWWAYGCVSQVFGCEYDGFL
jgi:hypothetical protein